MKHHTIEGILVILACFLLPFPSLGIIGTPVTASDLLLMLAGILVLLRSASVNFYLGKSTGWILWWVFASVLIIAGLLLSDMLRGNTLDNLLRITGQYFWAYLLIPLLLLSQPTKTLQTALFALLLGVLISVGLGAGLALVAPGLYQQTIAAGLFVIEDRVGAFLGPNAQAKLITFLLPFVFLQIALRAHPQWFWWAWVIIAGVGLVGAASFAGLISATVAIFGSLFILGKYFAKFTLHLSIVSMFLYAAIMFLAPTWSDGNFEASLDRLRQPLEMGSVEGISSYGVRMMLMVEAWEQIQRSPFIGLGPGKYSDYSAFQIKVHNTYLLLWAEGGILSFLGIAGFGSIPIFFAFYLWYQQRRHPRFRDASMFLGCYLLMVVIFMINIFSNTNSFTRYTVVPVLLTMLLLFRISLRETDHAQQGGIVSAFTDNPLRIHKSGSRRS